MAKVDQLILTWHLDAKSCESSQANKSSEAASISLRVWQFKYLHNADNPSSFLILVCKDATSVILAVEKVMAASQSPKRCSRKSKFINCKGSRHLLKI